MASIKEVTPMKENGKFCSRALSSIDKYSSVEVGETSFRVYYGATGAAVPFIWESQPGTPKHPIFNKSHNGNDHSIPPLTPPPSYTTPIFFEKPRSVKVNRARFLDKILSSITRKNSHVSPTSTLSGPLSWSVSSSCSSSFSSPRLGNGRKNNSKSHRRSISFCSTRAKSTLFDDEDHESVETPLAVCFGFKKNKQRRYSMQHMKDIIFSIRGH